MNSSSVTSEVYIHKRRLVIAPIARPPIDSINTWYHVTRIPPAKINGKLRANSSFSPTIAQALFAVPDFNVSNRGVFVYKTYSPMDDYVPVTLEDDAIITFEAKRAEETYVELHSEETGDYAQELCERLIEIKYNEVSYVGPDYKSKVPEVELYLDFACVCYIESYLTSRNLLNVCCTKLFVQYI